MPRPSHARPTVRIGSRPSIGPPGAEPFTLTSVAPHLIPAANVSSAVFAVSMIVTFHLLLRG
jgi:hypothetical protein